MKKRHNIALAAIAAAGFTFWAGGTQAAAYKCQDEKGKVVFSDIPCARKEPPPPKPEPKILPKVSEPATLTKLTEPDVLRAIGQTQDYARTNNHADMCGMMTADMKFKTDMQIVKPPRVIEGGREEACKLAQDNAEQSKRTGLISLIERGATKVAIEAGETRATAVYDSTVKLTRYDRIVSTYHCSSKEQFVLVGGKTQLAASESTCKP
jgi:hypothetical protein